MPRGFYPLWRLAGGKDRGAEAKHTFIVALILGVQGLELLDQGRYDVVFLDGLSHEISTALRCVAPARFTGALG
jgi:hypothetical protein